MSARTISSTRQTVIGGVVMYALVAPMAPAEATPLFEVELANPGVSIFRIEDLSTDMEELTSVQVGIGDTSWNFDIIGDFTTLQDAGAVLTPTLVQGDMAQDLTRVDELQIDFTGFEVGDRFQFNTDIDLDGSGNTASDFRTIYWNNDPADNAVITLSWRKTDGTTDQIMYVCPDDPEAKTAYTFLIPEPAVLTLLAAGGLVLLPHRRAG